ncbi:prostaglandin reductase 1-like [Condylostylus longicornis]|uniref:prostaglandin reductase 1-like n=1 Tax=Condylostylus longicornis TaxID=2530218 RepID=UPI00244DFD4D|nr:prostaglandin reductase 1-like [Condylostylus longicornis]
MVKGKRFIYAKAFEGEPNLDNFKLEEFNLPRLENGAVLCEAIFVSVDPYIRAFMNQYPIGTKIIGTQIAKVIDSRNPKYPVSSIICGDFGWQSHTVFVENGGNDIIPLTNFKSVPHSYALSCLGMPGVTAYFGFLEICRPQPGETVVITTAAGAVGCLVGQIAKIKQCKVIGFTGADDKCEWLVKECGFDYAFNYKTCDILQTLKNAAPNGIDCYFDNVGGEISSLIISQMNEFGRVSICGTISSYNTDLNDMPKAPAIQPLIIHKNIKLEGFACFRWNHRRSEAIKTMMKWIKEGKIKYKETITQGFENIPTAFIEMLKGKNIGKAIVKI